MYEQGFATPYIGTRCYRLDDGLAPKPQAQLILTGPPWRNVMWDPNLNTMKKHIESRPTNNRFHLARYQEPVPFNLEGVRRAMGQWC